MWEHVIMTFAVYGGAAFIAIVFPNVIIYYFGFIPGVSNYGLIGIYCVP